MTSESSLRDELKQRTAHVLDGYGARNRLTLVLGLFTAMVLGLAVPVMLDCLWLVAVILGGTTGQWVEIARQVMLCASLVFLAFPLCMGVYRVAVRMVQTHDVLRPDTLMPLQVCLHECFEVFSSPKAYIRSVVAGLLSLGRWGAVGVIPIGLWMLRQTYLPALETILPQDLYPLLETGSAGLILLVTAGAFAGACFLGGYAYLILARPQCSLRQIGKMFKSAGKPFQRNLRMTLHGLGEICLASLPVFIPLFLHTLPKLMIASAVYGEEMFFGRETDQPLPLV